MRWCDFSKKCQDYYSTRGSTWYHRNISLKLSNYVVYLSYRAGLSPNFLTVLSGVCCLLAMFAVLFFPRSLYAGLLNLAFLQLCFIFDCADGVLARIRGRTSKFGAFLDGVIDSFDHFLVFMIFGFVWARYCESHLSFGKVALFVICSSAYVFYFIVMMLVGQYFKELKGTMERFGENGLKERFFKLPYEFMNRGLHYLVLSLSFMMGWIYYGVLFYGLISACLTVALLVYLFLKYELKNTEVVQKLAGLS